MRFKIMAGIATLVAFFLAGCQSTMATRETETMMSEDTIMETDMMVTEFEVTIEVLSNSPTPLAPVAWAVHDGDNPFIAGQSGARLKGLEALAEDGNPSAAAETLSMLGEVSAHGVINTPVGGGEPGPATPGASYQFTVSAHEGERLSFATMYVQSNDLFYSPGAEGLELIEMGAPISGDVTSMILLYDAGTEVNEEPGAGPNQAPRQSGPNTGKDEMGQVTPIDAVDDMYMYPAIDAVMRVTVEPHEAM